MKLIVEVFGHYFFVLPESVAKELLNNASKAVETLEARELRVEGVKD